MSKIIEALGVGFLAVFIVLSVLGAANAIDFKVCISDAGRCHMEIRKERA